MARRGAQSGGARPQPGLFAIFEDFRPVFEWKYGNQAQPSHFLLIQLPGFAKEQIKVSTEGINTLKIRGERLIGGNKWSRFEEDFRIPDDCNIRGIRAKFENGTLTITMPKKGPIPTQVTPKKEEAQKPQLEAPLKEPDNKKGADNIEKETKQSENSVTEKEKESKKDDVVKEDTTQKANELDKENAKGSYKPINYIERIEKKDEEKSKEVQGKEIDKSKKVIEALNMGKEMIKESEGDGTGKGSNRPILNPENIEKKITSEEVKDKEKKKNDEVEDGIKSDNKAKEKEKGKELLKPKKYTENVATKKESYHEKVVKEIGKEESGEERQLLMNMGVSILVIVALGAYIYYGSFKKAKD